MRKATTPLRQETAGGIQCPPFDPWALVTEIAYSEIMKSPLSDASKSVRVNSEGIQQELSQVIARLKEATRRVADARFRKIAMKSTEVLKGLQTLFQRLGSEDDKAKGAERSASVAPDAKPSGRSSEVAGKESTKSVKRSSQSAMQNNSTAPSPGKGSVTVPAPSIAKSGPRGRKKVTSTPAPESAVPAVSAPHVATLKPEDPDEIAAKARLQQQEARAPKRPGGRAEPRPMPPQSGKPIWSKPHSS